MGEQSVVDRRSRVAGGAALRPPVRRRRCFQRVMAATTRLRLAGAIALVFVGAVADLTEAMKEKTAWAKKLRACSARR
jgi:hypothetical protein